MHYVFEKSIWQAYLIKTLQNRRKSSAWWAPMSRKIKTNNSIILHYLIRRDFQMCRTLVILFKGFCLEKIHY